MCGFLFLIPRIDAAGAKFLLTTLLAAGIAGCEGGHVNDGLPVVLAAARAGAVLAAQGSALALDGAGGNRRMMAASFCCL